MATTSRAGAIRGLACCLTRAGNAGNGDTARSGGTGDNGSDGDIRGDRPRTR
ncbi:hypothetical protein GCM10018779_21520 [Streptomyces griseocarneus]|nr:hypothetical protein GCM10018779_21520 [Streptomyces griseocarneus]